jgi:hypothetical protein
VRLRVLPLAGRTRRGVVTRPRCCAAHLRTPPACRRQVCAHQACHSPRARRAHRR